MVTALVVLAMVGVANEPDGVAANTARPAQSPVPAEAITDPAGPVSVQATSGLIGVARRLGWPTDARLLRGRWATQTITHVDTHARVVALTLDDGPHAGMIAKATDILDRAGAKATFFCVGGRVLLNGGEVRYAFDHGMEIENHTWSHRELTQSAAEDLSQVRSTDAIIGEVTGARPLWVRPRSGVADATGELVVRDLGHLMAGWDVHAGDTGNWNAAQISAHVLDKVHPGAIVDMHVTNPELLKALPSILSGLKARGYRMVTLSGLATLSGVQAPGATPGS